jgi:hypothetical protein
MEKVELVEKIAALSFFIIIIIIIINLLTCAYIVWVISPPCAPSSLEPVLCFSPVKLKSRNKQ